MHALFLTTALLLGTKPAAASPPADDSYDTTIDGQLYNCSSSDLTGRYETTCTPVAKPPAAAGEHSTTVSTH